MPSNATYAENVHSILQCSDGDILEASWASEDYVFCVSYDSVTQENRVTEVATDGLHLEIGYISEDDVPQDVLSAITQDIPPVPDITNADADMTCPTLSFDGYTSEIKSSDNRKLLSRWYEKSGVAHSTTKGRRQLFSSFNFYIETTVEEYDLVQSFAVQVLQCTYFCGPAEFGHRQVPISSLASYVYKVS